MSNKLDVDDLINWLNQSEDEAKATVAESGATADPFYDGVLSAIFQIREYIKKMCKIDDAEGKADQSWIPCSERFPDNDRYILVSFENSTLPDIARYERDTLVLIGYGLYGSIARGFFLEGDEWKYSEEERKQANETFKGLSITHQMLVFLHGSMNTVGETYDYSGRYAKEKADKLLKGYEALELFGWFFEMDEEKQVLDGTSELFAPAEEK